MPETPKARAVQLPLRFSCGREDGGIDHRRLSWRDGGFSDWSVQFGEKCYNLHAFILARASSFFESHMSHFDRLGAGKNARTMRGSDLTEVLPQCCHASFEDALDFIYSENQATFEAPVSKVVLLLKIADILGIGGLFEAMGKRIEETFEEAAPLLLEQYCRFHIPGTDDGAALKQMRDSAVGLIVRKFQTFAEDSEIRTSLLRLPVSVLAEILEADDLLVAGEDIVFDFLAPRVEACGSALAASGCGSGADVSSVDNLDDCSDGSLESLGPRVGRKDSDVLWRRVRWGHLSTSKFAQVLAPGQRLLRPKVAMHALTVRATQLDLVGSGALNPNSCHVLPRRQILPPEVPPPSSMEIDLCFHFARSDQYIRGEAIRSQPKRIGDIVLRLLVFPVGTNTGVAPGSFSVFFEAVPQPHWPRTWEFANLRYTIVCYRWPKDGSEPGGRRQMSEHWTFRADRLDRGWHDFMAPGEIHKYFGPDGFVCLRGSLEPESLSRVFLLDQAGGSSLGRPADEAAASSASRRS